MEKSKSQVVNLDIATMYTVEIAMLFGFFVYWITQNLKKDTFDLEKGMYISANRLGAHFTCFSEDKIYRILRKMVGEGLLKRKKVCKAKGNQTYWYSLGSVGISLVEKYYPNEYKKLQNAIVKTTNSTSGDSASSTSGEPANSTSGESANCYIKIDKSKINKNNIDKSNIDKVFEKTDNNQFTDTDLVKDKVLNHLNANGGKYGMSGKDSKVLNTLVDIFPMIERYTKNEELQYLLIDFFEAKLCDNSSFHQFKRNLDRLDRLADNDEEKKIKIVEQAVCAGYKGFFEIKDKQKSDDLSDLPF